RRGPPQCGGRARRRRLRAAADVAPRELRRQPWPAFLPPRDERVSVPGPQVLAGLIGVTTMRNRIKLALRAAAAFLLLATAIAAAQAPAQPPPALSEAARRHTAETNTLPDPPGPGRFAAMKEEVASLPKHVIYRPANLATLGGQKLGV